MIPTKIFTATKALIVHNGKILILKESSNYKDGANAGKYDVPGGRVEPGQRFDESLKREIMEETGLTVSVIKPIYVDEWRPVVRGEQWQIIGIYFLCESKSSIVRLSVDHEAYEWIDFKDAVKYTFAPTVNEAFKALENIYK